MLHLDYQEGLNPDSLYLAIVHIQTISIRTITFANTMQWCSDHHKDLEEPSQPPRLSQGIYGCAGGQRGGYNHQSTLQHTPHFTLHAAQSTLQHTSHCSALNNAYYTLYAELHTSHCSTKLPTSWHTAAPMTIQTTPTAQILQIHETRIAVALEFVIPISVHFKL